MYGGFLKKHKRWKEAYNMYVVAQELDRQTKEEPEHVHYKEIDPKTKETLEILHACASCYEKMETRNNKTLVKLYYNILRLTPFDPDVVMKLGDTFWDMGKHEK